MGYGCSMLGMMWKGKEGKWAWAGVPGKDQMSKQIYMCIYIYYIYIYNMIIFTKHILRHVKQHKEPALWKRGEREVAEGQTLILGISHVFLKISLKKKRHKERGRHGKTPIICFLWMDKVWEKMEKGRRVTWELIPPASLWGRKDKFGVLELSWRWEMQPRVTFTKIC